MNWIPAVIFLVGFIPQCERTPTADPATTADAGAKSDAGGSTTKVDTTPPAPEPKTGPFLWEVTKQGNHRTSWIFGVVDQPNTSVEFELAPELVKLGLTKSSHAVFEIPSGSAAQRDRTNLMPMKDEEGSLKQELGAERFEKLLAITKETAPVLDIMHPWVVYLTLEEKLSANPPMGQAYEGFAGSYRKRPIYLETVHEEVAVLKKVIDFATLQTLIDEHDGQSGHVDALAEAYATGDAEKVVIALYPPGDTRGQIFVKLADERVPRWATKLDTQFSNDPTFAVINMRYLVGPTNLVDALRARGWKVERATP